MNRSSAGWVVAALLAVALVGVVVFNVTTDEGTRTGALRGGPAGVELPDNAAEEAQRILEAKRTEGERALPKVEGDFPRLDTNPPMVCDPNLPPNVSADWLDQPQALRDAAGLASHIVVGTVNAIEDGPSYVADVPGEPGGSVQTPVQQVRVRVDETVKGAPKPGDTLSVERLGDARGCYRVEGDPPYAQGERYLLLLRDGREGRTLMQPISPPSGRFRVNQDGLLEASSHVPFIRDVAGQRLEQVIAKVRGG